MMPSGWEGEELEVKACPRRLDPQILAGFVQPLECGSDMPALSWQHPLL